MPTPIPLEQAPLSAGVDALYVRDRQDWAIVQERQRHDQSLYLVGEYAAFALMWHIEDYTAGLVGRCLHCFTQSDSLKSRVAAVYSQPTQQKCPDCYGSTFEGGFKALIIRPTIFTDADKNDAVSQRGITHSMELNVESTSDFRVRTGDYVIRATGDRFYLRVPTRTTLRTGYGTPFQLTTSIDYNLSRAALEDSKASVAYTIPPSASTLNPLLTQTLRRPIDFTAFETIRAPLIPVSDETAGPPPATPPDITDYNVDGGLSNTTAYLLTLDDGDSTPHSASVIYDEGGS